MPEEITLWSDSLYASPWVLCVWVTLKEKGVPFRVKTLDLAKGEQKQGDYPEQTLTGKVPALRHNDLLISESLAIVEYLEEIFPPPTHRSLLPTGSAARARDRQISLWLRTDLQELRRCMSFDGVFMEQHGPAVTTQAREDAEKLLRVAQTHISTRRQDAAPTVADFDLAFALRRLISYRYDLLTRTGIVAYAESIWARESVQSWVAQTR